MLTKAVYKCWWKLILIENNLVTAVLSVVLSYNTAKFFNEEVFNSYYVSHLEVGKNLV